MRARASSSTIGAMFLHPDMLLEIARQRIEDLLAEVQSHRVAQHPDGLRGRSPARAGQQGQHVRHGIIESAAEVPESANRG